MHYGTKIYCATLFQWNVQLATTAHKKTIDQIQKSHNSPVPYPTMYHSKQKCSHFCSEWCIVGYIGQMHCWVLWDWSISSASQELCTRFAVCYILWYDDVIKWKHFPRYWPFVRGIHRWPVNSWHKGQWRRALMFSLICAWINGWVNSGEAGDFRRCRAHYDVTVMSFWPISCRVSSLAQRQSYDLSV